MKYEPGSFRAKFIELAISRGLIESGSDLPPEIDLLVDILDEAYHETYKEFEGGYGAMKKLEASNAEKD